jgi:hypothetical protein
MDELISRVFRAFSIGAPEEDIKAAILEKGWSEEDCELALVAGKLLYQWIAEVEEEKPKPVFRRVDN